MKLGTIKFRFFDKTEWTENPTRDDTLLGLTRILSILESDKPLYTLLKMWFYIFTFKIFTFEREREARTTAAYIWKKKKKGNGLVFRYGCFLLWPRRVICVFSQNYITRKEIREYNAQLFCSKLIINKLDTLRGIPVHVACAQDYVLVLK